MKRFFLTLLAVILVASVVTTCKTQKKQEFSKDIVFQGKSVEDYLRSGDRKLTARNYKAALEDFDKAAEMDPFGADIYNYRGMAKLLLEDYAGALIDFNKTIELQPDYAEAYNLRGIVKGELNDEVGACEDWEKAFELGFRHAFQLLKKFCAD